MKMTSLTVGVDASRSRSGGAVAHVVGLVEFGDPRSAGIGTVHIWAHDALLERLPARSWLVSHPVAVSRQAMAFQILWQRYWLPATARKLGVHAMFNTDAGSFCDFRPSVTLSQDLLAFEPGELSRYGWHTKARFRLEVLRLIQLRRLRKSNVALFLSRHARSVFERLGGMPDSKIIQHGVDPFFFDVQRVSRPAIGNRSVKCIYVSNAAPYKHQWHVIDAIRQLRGEGLDVRLRLVGGGRGQAQRRLVDAMARFDPEGQFVHQVQFVPHKEIAHELASADVFIFASSCESLPVTLLEAMAAGLPIASSNRGPMPETLGDAGLYFDPEQPGEIAAAVRRLVEDGELRVQLGDRARQYARDFTWSRCAAETWSALADVARGGR